MHGYEMMGFLLALTNDNVGINP